MDATIGIPIAIVAAAVIVAGAILMTNHCQLTTGNGAVFRLNRWDGTVTICQLPQGWIDQNRNLLAGGIWLPCEH
jgi:hypothetical protein